MMRLSDDLSNAKVNWTEYFINAIELSKSIVNLTMDANLPSLEHFMLYSGNLTEWMTRLDRAFQMPGFTEFNKDTSQW